MTANIFQPKLHRKSLLSLFHKFDKEKKKEKKKYLAEPVETTRPLPLHQPIADQDYLYKYRE
jgi:hypothetical protein